MRFGTDSDRNKLVALLSLLVLIAVLAPGAIAQRSGAHSAGSHHGSSGGFSRGRNMYSAGFRRSAPLTSLPFSFFGDSFDPGDIYSTGYPVSSDPPAYLLQAVRGLTGDRASSAGSAMGASVGHAPPSTQPLMIELHGGRYVRVSDPAIDGEGIPLRFAAKNVAPAATGPVTAGPITDGPVTAKAAAKEDQFEPAPVALAPAARELPSTLLVFRDGRSEEVRDYTIADGILYARGDFYADGYWIRKISLGALDLARTQQVNSTRNVSFVLPASSNEVIARF